MVLVRVPVEGERERGGERTQNPPARRRERECVVYWYSI